MGNVFHVLKISLTVFNASNKMSAASVIIMLPILMTLESVLSAEQKIIGSKMIILVNVNVSIL